MHTYLEEDKIMSNWNFDLVPKTTVSIVCHTYNHEKYIHKAIEGFLSQKTNFPFEIIIHDDASNDITTSILKDYKKKYPNLITLILQKENQYSINTNIWSEFTFPIASGKYIAICEGDDFWTDQNKLQMQVDFLEKNNQYVICWTNFVSLKGKLLIENDFETKFPKLLTIDFDNVFSSYNTYSLTTVFRKDALNLADFNSLKFTKDNTLFSLILKNGKGVFINSKTAIYRLHEGGVFSLKPSFFKNYSSYLNLNEIYEKIDQAKTENIRQVCNYLCKESANEALKIYCSRDNLDTEQKQFLKNYFINSNIKYKFKFLKKYIEYKFSK